MTLKRRDVLINGLAWVVAVGCGGSAFAEEGKFCVDCVHYRPIRGGKVWYDRYCGRVKRQQAIDPVTGETVYVDKSGDMVGNKYPHARDVNGRGQCWNFEAKP